MSFSRDGTRVLTLLFGTNSFALWSVPDGQLIAVNTADPSAIEFDYADIGVPGSASDGLVGLFSSDSGAVCLWDVSPPTGGGANRPRLRSRVDLEPGDPWAIAYSLSFSPDGSKFAAIFRGVAYVYDVASLTRLGAYTSPSDWPGIAWAPSGQLVLVSWFEKQGSACAWDFTRPEAPSIVTARVGDASRFYDWSPSGASYFVMSERRATQLGPVTFVLEERRVTDGASVRTARLTPLESRYSLSDFKNAQWRSPDSRAFLIANAGPGYVSARVVLLE